MHQQLQGPNMSGYIQRSDVRAILTSQQQLRRCKTPLAASDDVIYSVRTHAHDDGWADAARHHVVARSQANIGRDDDSLRNWDCVDACVRKRRTLPAEPKDLDIYRATVDTDVVEADSVSVESQKESGYHSEAESINDGGSVRLSASCRTLADCRTAEVDKCSFGESDDYHSVQQWINGRPLAPDELCEHYFVRAEAEMDNYQRLECSIEVMLQQQQLLQSVPSADDREALIQTALGHINMAIECFELALKVPGVSPSILTRLRTRCNTAILRRRRILVRMNDSSKSQTSNSNRTDRMTIQTTTDYGSRSDIRPSFPEAPRMKRNLQSIESLNTVSSGNARHPQLHNVQSLTDMRRQQNCKSSLGREGDGRLLPGTESSSNNTLPKSLKPFSTDPCLHSYGRDTTSPWLGEMPRQETRSWQRNTGINEYLGSSRPACTDRSLHVNTTHDAPQASQHTLASDCDRHVQVYGTLPKGVRRCKSSLPPEFQLINVNRCGVEGAIKYLNDREQQRAGPAQIRLAKPEVNYTTVRDARYRTEANVTLTSQLSDDFQQVSLV